MRNSVNLTKVKNTLDQKVIDAGDKVSSFTHEQVLKAYDRRIRRLHKRAEALRADLPIGYQLTDEGDAAARANLTQALKPFEVDLNGTVTR